MNKFSQYIGLYAVTSVVYRGAGFLLFVWLAKTFAVPEYARWGLLYAFQTAVVTFSLVGIIESITNLLHKYPEQEQRAVLFSSAIDVFLRIAAVSVILATVGGLLIQRYGNGSVEFESVPGALFSGVLLAYATLMTQIYQLEGRHVVAVAFSFLFPVCGLTGSLIATAFVPSAGAYFLGGMAAMMLAAVAYRKHLAIRNFGRSSPEVRNQIYARIAPYVAVALFGWLGGYGNNIIVNHIFQPAEVARFTFSLTVASVMQLAATSLNQVWSPRFYQIVQLEPIDVVERMNWRFYGLQSVILGIVGAASLIVLPLVTGFLGGNLVEYGGMQTELFFIVIGYVCLCPWWHCMNYLLFFDKGPTVMRVTIVTSAIGITIWISLMLAFGAIGIYLGFFLQMVVRSVGIAYVVKRQWPIRNSWAGVFLGIGVALIALLTQRN